MAWFVQRTVLLIVALIAGLVVWKSDAVALVMGWPPTHTPGPFPIGVYAGGVFAGLLLNEVARLNWSRIGIQVLVFLRHLGGNVVMAAFGIGCAFIVLYA